MKFADMSPEEKQRKLDILAKAREARKQKADEKKAVKAVEDHVKHIEEMQENVEQASNRTNPRTEVRTGPRGRSEVIGRNGEVLSRRRTHAGDIFDVPKDLIPEGWEYQWCAVSVVGNTEILLDQNLMMAENGWRPVPADRYPGKFMPVGHKGSIIRGGQMLMERPKQLSDEAREEDLRLARQLISDRNDSLKLSAVKKQMGEGFEMSQKYRGTGGDIRMSIDKGLDVPRPKYDLADD